MNSNSKIEESRLFFTILWNRLLKDFKSHKRTLDKDPLVLKKILCNTIYTNIEIISSHFPMADEHQYSSIWLYNYYKKNNGFEDIYRIIDQDKLKQILLEMDNELGTSKNSSKETCEKFSELTNKNFRHSVSY